MMQFYRQVHILNEHQKLTFCTQPCLVDHSTLCGIPITHLNNFLLQVLNCYIIYNTRQYNSFNGFWIIKHVYLSCN